MPNLISLLRNPIRGHPFEFIIDIDPEQESGTGWSLSANVCGGFIPNLIRGSEFYQPVAGTTLTYIIAGVIVKAQVRRVRTNSGFLKMLPVQYTCPVPAPGPAVLQKKTGHRAFTGQGPWCLGLVGRAGRTYFS